MGEARDAFRRAGLPVKRNQFGVADDAVDGALDRLGMERAEGRIVHVVEGFGELRCAEDSLEAGENVG